MNTATGTSAHDPLTPHPHLLVRWFVQYNPMFTASALCVLGGVLLTQRALGEGSALALTGVVELYQWLVIGTAALLYRRLHDHRPGVILGLIALVFLVDPTLQTSALASEGHALLPILWVALFAAKLHALAWSFCLRLSTSARLVPVLGAALIVTLPQLRMTEYASLVPGGLAVGLFVIGLLAALVPPTMKSTRTLSEVGEVMYPRLVKATIGIGVVGALYQGGNAVFAEGAPAFFAALMAVAAVVVVHALKEGFLWGAVVATLWASTIAGLTTAVGLPMLAVALLVAGRRHPPRVLVAGLVAAAWPSVLVRGADLSGDNLADIAIVVVASVALGYLLVQRRAFSSPLGLALLHARFLKTAVFPAVAATSGGTWGVVLVVAGFGLIPLGVAAHRRLSAILADSDRATAHEQEAAAALAMLQGGELSSSSSAAVPSM